MSWLNDLNFQGRKDELAAKVIKAAEYGLISDKDRDDLIEKIDKEVLTFGVIGQIKAGKSTFLNTFIFEDDVLPAAVTPMTSSLCIITYGDKKSMTAEFYTREEWEEISQLAIVDPSQCHASFRSKIESAKMLVDASQRMGDEINQWLDKGEKEDALENLAEYVGEKGKYVAITKSARIYYPNPALKGIEIVDTPGFNDPCEYREKRTLEFLRNADAVLMLIYAGMPFSDADKDILFCHLSNCGVGKVIIGINKYDVAYENGDTEEMITALVRRRIDDVIESMNDSLMSEIVADAKLIPCSAQMALLSMLPIEKIRKDIDYSHAWGRYNLCFDDVTKDIIKQSQPALWNHSYIDVLSQAVTDMVTKEKNALLFLKPDNFIRSAAATAMDDMDKSLKLHKSKLENITASETELQRKYSGLEQIRSSIEERIDELDNGINEFLELKKFRWQRELEDVLDAFCKKMISIVDQWGLFQDIEIVRAHINNEYFLFISRYLKRAVEEISEEINRRVKRMIRDFVSDVEDQFELFFPELDREDLIRRMLEKYTVTIVNDDIFRTHDTPDEEPGLLDNLVGAIKRIIDAYMTFKTAGLWLFVKKGVEYGTNALYHNEFKTECMKMIEEFQKLDMLSYLSLAFGREGRLISSVRNDFISELIDPLQIQIQEILDARSEREEVVRNTMQEITVLEQKIEELKCHAIELGISI